VKNKPVRVEPEADDELAAAVDWYESQRAGLGSELWFAIRRTLQQVQEMPAAFALVPGAPDDLPARAAFVRKFPYKIVYFDLPEVIHVLAFAHLRREPRYWQARGH
jgi:toxin ParE1/3/4